MIIKQIVTILMVICIFDQSISQQNFSSNEFVLLLERPNLTRIQLSTGQTTNRSLDSTTFSTIFEYDMKNDCVFYTPDDPVILRQFGKDESEILVKYGLPYGALDMAYDWMSQTLYFAHNNLHGSAIEAIDVSSHRPKEADRWRHQIILTNSTYPRLVVHPEAGYIFWTEWSIGGLYRANLDGSGAQRLLGKPYVVEATQLMVDSVLNRVFWYDKVIDYVASCDLNGNDFRVHFEAKTTGIFDSTSYVFEVHNGVLYYGKDQSEEDNDDPTNAYKRPIWMLDLKKENATAQLLSVNRTNWEQFRVYSDQSQVGTNACGDGRHNCSHLCVAHQMVASSVFVLLA